MSAPEPGWYARGGYIRGLSELRLAAQRAVDVHAQLQASADYITEHYRRNEEKDVT